MRVKKPGFLKVFERIGERDNCPLLDVGGGGSMHGNETPSPYVAPPSMMHTKNERDVPERDSDRGVSRKQHDTKSLRDNEQYPNNLAASNGSNRIGELPMKPRPNNDTFATQEEPRRDFFGRQKKDTDDNPSSSSEDDYYYQAAVTTQSGDDDADTFVQFTLESVNPSIERHALAPVREKEEDENRKDITSSDTYKPLSQGQNSVETMTPLLLKVEAKSETVAQTRASEHAERPSLGATGKSISKRNLARQGSLRALLEKDKPSVDEEVQKLLNLKTRPGLGGRKQSDRNLRRDGTMERQLPTKRGLLKKAASERSLGVPSRHTTVTTENDKVPLVKSKPKASDQYSIHKFENPVDKERSRPLDKTMSIKASTDMVQDYAEGLAALVFAEDSSTASLTRGEATLGTALKLEHVPSNQCAKHSSDQPIVSDGFPTPLESECDQPRKSKGAEVTEPMAPRRPTADTKQFVKSEFGATSLTDQKSIESCSEAAIVDNLDKIERRKSNDSSESARRNTQLALPSPENSPSRKSKKPAQPSESGKDPPAVPLSPRRPSSLRVRGNVKSRTSTSQSSLSTQDIVISWSRSPGSSSLGRSSKKKSSDTRRKDKDSSSDRTRRTRMSGSKKSHPNEDFEIKWSRSPKPSTKRNSTTISSEKVSQWQENSSRQSKDLRLPDDDELIELTEGEIDERERGGKESRETMYAWRI